MLDKSIVVTVPDGAIVKSNRLVFWTLEKIYLRDKRYNNDKRKLIGKTLEADCTHMYPNDNYKELFPDDYQSASQKRLLPSSQSIGMYLAVKTIVERISLYEILYSAFGKEDTDLILDYAMYEIIFEKDVSMGFENGMKNKALFSEQLRSDSYLSTFFRKNITEERISLFLELWATRAIKDRQLQTVYLNVDGSNVDCEAVGVSLKEHGHDKSGKKTTVVGIMYVVAPDGTGLFYHQYRGSVIDAKAVKYVLLFFKHLGVKIKGFCADRGFCTKDDTDFLRSMGLDFVLMMTSQPEGFAVARSQLRDQIRNNVRKWLDGTELFGDCTKVRMFKNDKVMSYLHVFYDSVKGGFGIKNLLKKVNKAKKQVLKAIRDKTNPMIPDEVKPYMNLRKRDGSQSLELEESKLQDAIDDKGFYVLATSEEMPTIAAHDIYRARDSSEKQYMFMKSEIGLEKYRTGSDRSICGKQFVAFIAGIIRNEIKLASKKMLSQKDRTDRYSVPPIIDELVTIRIKRLPGNEYALVMDLSARDEFMLKHLCITRDALDACVKTQNLRIKGKNR